MQKMLILIVGAFLFSFSSIINAKIEGFYKDVFQDAGTGIYGNMTNNCAKIQYTQEKLTLCSGSSEEKSPTQAQKDSQICIMVKSNIDANGFLLYPDNAPRYALMYFHGGFMSHANDLGDEGKKRVRAFYFNGGSEFGSCAGSYMLAKGNWFNIWPGKVGSPNVSSTPVDKIVNNGSPLIGYNDLKAGDTIMGVFHNNGGCVDTATMPKGTQICLMHNSDKLKGYADIWTWKDHDTTGRVAGITGHPEGSSKANQMRYFNAVMLYLTDHLGKPRLKNTIKNNETITMDKKTEDNNPKFTMIGDKQYHHFLLECKSASNLKITVTGQDGFDFHVFVAKDTFAFKAKAAFSDTTAGAVKTLAIPKLENGTWYVGVKLNTTVTADESNKIFPTYSGKLEVLNGIAYSIKASWEGTSILANDLTIKGQFSAFQKNRTVFINVGRCQIQSLKVFDLKGRLCWEPSTLKNMSSYIWKPSTAGMYIIRITSPTGMLTRHISIAQ